MTDIGPVSQSHAAALDGAGSAYTRRAPQTATTSRGTDSVELSSVAQWLSKLSETPDVREDLVSRVKAEIENGTYETPKKINAAIDAMLDDLA